MPTRQHLNHPREWQQNLYVYPVISRRSHGLSIGVNLNPDTACNFDCVYCQVDRTGTPKTRKVDLSILEQELASMVAIARDGTIFDTPDFNDVPAPLRRINDIAFSGDGEPTTCPVFKESVALTAAIKKAAGLEETKIVLITDACYLTKPMVVEALAIMDANSGEIWAKLDAGTEDYFQRVNRPSHSLQHVVENITAAAQVRPVVIQSLFMRLDGVGPDRAEIDAYVEQLSDILNSSGRIDYVQVYTVARQPAESFVTALSIEEVDAIVQVVGHRTNLRAEAFYSH